MNSKFYVSLEAARLLKEKGYDKDVRNFYDEEGLFLEVEGFYNFEYLTNEELDNNHYSAPTKSEAIDWLESKGIVVELSYDDKGHLDEARWEYFVYTHDKNGWVDAMVCSWEEYNYYKTRLEAEEAAIIKALELL